MTIVREASTDPFGTRKGTKCEKLQITGNYYHIVIMRNY